MWNGSIRAHVNLINVDLLELLLHRLHPHLHGLDGGVGVLQRFRGEVGLFHVERLCSQVVRLVFVPKHSTATQFEKVRLYTKNLRRFHRKQLQGFSEEKKTPAQKKV